MFTNLYPLTNMVYINLRRTQFLCDLITGTTIDICAHIFYIIRKTVTWIVARGCLPFCSLIMKFILSEGVTPSSVGKIIAHPRPISMSTLQASRSHSSKTPKSAHFSPATPSTSEPDSHVHATYRSQQPSITQAQSSPQLDRLEMLFENLHKRLEKLEKTLREDQKE